MSEGSASHHIPINFLNTGLTIHLNTIIEVWVVMLFILVVSYLSTKKLSKYNISPVQYCIESIYDVLKDQVFAQITWKPSKFMPFIGGIFFFVMFAYWFGLLPFWKFAHLIPSWPSTGDGSPLEITSPTSDINVTLGLASLSILSYLLAGTISSNGTYWLPYFGLSYHHGKISFSLVNLITALIEWLDLLVRPLTLSLRLFANTFAGEALVITLIKLVPLLVPVVGLGFEIFVGGLQAFIFAMLTTVYIAMACSHGTHGEHEEEHEPSGARA